MCTRCEGLVTSDPSYRPWQDTLSCSAVETTAEVNRRGPQCSRDARRCPAGPKTKSRGAPLPETGPQADGDQRRPRLGSQFWPVLYLKACAPAKRTGGKRVDTPGGDRRRPVPALARRPSVFQHSPPPLLPVQGHLHVPLQRGSRRPAQPTSQLPGAMLRPAHPVCDPPRHFREWWQSGAEPGAAGGALNSGVPSVCEVRDQL